MIAGIIFAIVLVLFWLLSDTLKFAGAPFLYLPDKLGILRQVRSTEIYAIDLASVPTTIDIAQPGRYLVFTGDFKLLQLNVLSDARNKPWLSLRALETSRPVTLTSVARGLRPYDTPLTKGRPIFAFEIETPGAYEFSYPVRSASIALVPDYTTGNEVTITLVYAVQIAVILFVLGAVSRYRRRGFRAWKRKLDGLQQQRRTRGEIFWQNEIQRIEEEQERER
ncbi:MAG: hypothetical protein ACJ8CR_10220 [Roseiflexaceae bacterium]